MSLRHRFIWIGTVMRYSTTRTLTPEVQKTLSLTKAGRTTEATIMFQKHPHNHSASLLMARSQSVDDADRIFAALTSPDLPVIKALLSIYRKTGNKKKALMLWNKAMALKIEPDIAFFGSVVVICNELKDYTLAQQLLQQALKGMPNLKVCSSMCKI
jgi:pentatricopeptide repeat protein